MTKKEVFLPMEPFPGEIDLNETAVIIIDMQGDFLEPCGFGEAVGADVSKVQRAIAPCKVVLESARAASLVVIHTREGHRPDMLDLHERKRSNTGGVIGRQGPKGRIFIRGEKIHDIIPDLYPIDGEAVIDKPGKGAFYATDLDTILKAQRISTVLVCGVTTEICVQSTIREGNDRGYHMIVVEDACASYVDQYHDQAIELIITHKGIFGSKTNSAAVEAALAST